MTTEKIHTLLRALTERVNLKEVSKEWSYVNWEALLGRIWTVKNLKEAITVNI